MYTRKKKKHKRGTVKEMSRRNEKAAEKLWTRIENVRTNCAKLEEEESGWSLLLFLQLF